MTKIVSLKEWDGIVLDGVELADSGVRNLAKILTGKGILEIIEIRGGLSIKSNSYVGRVKLGDLQIDVYPKINGLPLYQLLRYAYGLRDLKLFNTAEHNLGNFSFFDLLIYELYVEAEDLIQRGLQKSYIKEEECLSSPRGRIDMNKLCAQGGLIKDTLPCRYFARDEDNILNQILLSGLRLGLKLVMDDRLKFNLQRLISYLKENVCDIILTRTSLNRAWNSINRLTERYSSILRIINILYESQGIQLDDGLSSIDLNGYFFDMNAFFETLIGRLLEDFGGGFSVKCQYSLHDMFTYVAEFNPRLKKSPTPRPDFAIVKQGKVIKLIDAKYRDLWHDDLPREMLYQLSVYAVSGIGNKTSTILYPATSDIPTIQKIDINDPVSGSKIASIILQPVNLIKIAELITDESRRYELMNYIDEVVWS